MSVLWNALVSKLILLIKKVMIKIKLTEERQEKIKELIDKGKRVFVNKYMFLSDSCIKQIIEIK